MNVFSKLSTKLALLGSRTAEPRLELECDNPDCKYRNSLQTAKGRYNCKNFLPGIGNCSKSGWSCDTAGDESVRRERCPGTYHVSAEQAYYASQLFYAANSEHYKRADLKRDKAARKAAREARSRAVKLASEVEKELKRELLFRKQERMRMGREEGQITDETQQPAKRLKREIRRLPMTIRTTVPSIADAPSLKPTLRRRHTSDTPPRPRPVAICLDKFSLTSPLPSAAPDADAVPQTTQASRAQYPVVSRPVFSARNRSVSMNDVNDRATSSTQEQEQKQDSPFCLRRRVTYAQARWVSYKNGLMITHFGTLVPTSRVCVSPLLDGGKSSRGSGG